MLTELRTALPVSTPRGNGFAFAVIDYGQEHHLLWVVVIDATGEIWTIANPEIRVRPNPTMGAPRVPPDLIKGD